MEHSLVMLVAANVAFVGSHFAMSHPLRAPMVKALGAGGFQVAYTLVSAATLAWVYFAFLGAPANDLGGSGEAGWIIATVLALPAMVLLAGSFIGNPALPTPMAEAQARSQPKGVFLITRHPMMWAFGLWAASHLVLLWSMRTMITAFAIGLLALVGAHMQDRKKRELMGDAWREWSAKTSYWPRLSGFAKAGLVPWAGGIALFLIANYIHLWRAGIPAGIFRWVG